MSKMIVKAVGPKGHWAFGRFWPHASATELEIVEEPEEEKSRPDDSHEDGVKKFALRGARLEAGKATAKEAAQIRAYPHLVEIIREECARCKDLEEKIKALESAAKPEAKKALK